MDDGKDVGRNTVSCERDAARMDDVARAHAEPVGELANRALDLRTIENGEIGQGAGELIEDARRRLGFQVLLRRLAVDRIVILIEIAK